MSKTPITDEQEFRVVDNIDMMVITSDFAREIETLNAELVAALVVARSYMNLNGEQSRIEIAQVDAAIAKATL